MKTAEISRSHDSRLQPTISTPRLIGEGSLVFDDNSRFLLKIKKYDEIKILIGSLYTVEHQYAKAICTNCHQLYR